MILKAATWLKNRGRADAFDLSPAQIDFAVRVEHEHDRATLFQNAISTAVGTNGKEKHFEAIRP